MVKNINISRNKQKEIYDLMEKKLPEDFQFDIYNPVESAKKISDYIGIYDQDEIYSIQVAIENIQELAFLN